MKSALTYKLIGRLSSGNQTAIDYVLRYFSSEIFARESPPDWSLACALRERLEADDKQIYDSLWFIESGPCHKDWIDELKESMDKFKIRNPELVADDDIPF
jgi:hypothetical protein